MTTILKLENVTVEFPIYTASINPTLLNTLIKRNNDIQYFKALDNVSLVLKEGDRVGLVGNNGAGKTTLLRVMAGILPPTTGKVHNAGNRVLPLINKNTDVYPALTCLQNITLHGLRNKLKGENLSNYVDNVRAIVDLDKFMDSPAKNLSSGMRNRLVLSMFHADPADVIVMDEWIGTSDEQLLNYGEGILHNLIERSKVFILASHLKNILDAKCNRTIRMNGGKILSN